MNSRRSTMTFAALTATLLTTMFARTVPAAAPPSSSAARLARGAHLVETMGCNDCHTPLKLGPNGPEPDMTRALTGHPEQLVMPAPPALPTGPWVTVVSATNTAWAGPWGVSFTMNLTPDEETGLGKWTEEQFIATMRTGRHQGKGRHLLPPMPYWMVGALSDPDLKDLFLYLRSLKPVSNHVPQPVDPPEGTH